MKLLGLFTLMHMRVYKRPASRSWLFDAALFYMGSYSFLLSNVVGVHKTWNQYEGLAQKMIGSQKKVKTDEILDAT